MRTSAAAVAVILLVAVGGCRTEIVCYTDSQGGLHVVDDIGKVPKEYRKQVANVEVYLTSWCGYCKKMVQFLNEKGIPFTAYDVEKDAAAYRRYHELGGNGVPVVRIGSHVVHGYNPDAVMDYYHDKK